MIGAATLIMLAELGLACRQVLLVAGPSPSESRGQSTLEELMVFDEPAPLCVIEAQGFFAHQTTTRWQISTALQVPANRLQIA